MTTGAPIYLVSACRSGAEFVAAFRRYADKNGLFVPIADPIPAGRRGRFAVTLADGGVMVEGHAEIVSSSRTPSVLHGRIGMTLRFVEPDIKSKTVLVELEQARLAQKPEPPSVPPRAAEIPATPRPVPPPAGGRIDAHTALAECVAIGDVAALEATTAHKAAPKFSVPAIPPVGTARPRTPSGAVPLAVPAQPSGATPRPPSGGVPVVAPKQPTGSVPVAAPKPAPRTQTPSVPPPLTPPPAALLQAHPHPQVSPRTSPPLAERDTVATPPLAPGRDTEAMAAVVPGPFSTTLLATMPAPSSERDSETMQAAIPEPLPASSASGSISQPNGRPGLPPPRRTSNTSPPPRMPTPAQPLPVVPRSPTPAAPLPTVKHPSGATPIAGHRNPTSIGMPIVNPKAPAAPAPSLVPAAPVVPAAPAAAAALADADAAEPTAVTEIPIPQEVVEPIEMYAPPAATPAREAREPRRTVIGVAVSPDGVPVLPAAPATPAPARDDDAPRDTALMATPEPSAGIVGPRTVDGRAQTLPPEGPAVEIQEPTGDWTMSPGADAPTILPRPARASEPPPVTGAVPAKLPTGDWTIARVEDSPDGWSEPAKVAKPPPAARLRQHAGLAAPVVSGEKPLEVTMTAKEFEIEEATKSGNKVEIDAELAAASQSLPASAPAASSGSLRPSTIPTAHVAPLPPPRLVTDGGSGFFRESGDLPRYPTGESTALEDRRRRTRLVVILASAALAIAVGIVVLFALGSRKPPADAAASGTAPAAVPIDAAALGATVDAAAPMAVAPPPVDAAVAAVADAPPEPAPPAAPTECTVDVTSTPTGAEILRGKDVLGTTPATLTLPCGTATRLVLRKGRLAPTPRTVTPSPNGTRLRVALAKPLFAVKVSSTPPGATITSRGKTLGVTPTAIKLPANEAATLVITKDGFTSDTRKITPKQNNQAVHATLKRKGRR